MRPESGAKRRRWWERASRGERGEWLGWPQFAGVAYEDRRLLTASQLNDVVRVAGGGYNNRATPPMRKECPWMPVDKAGREKAALSFSPADASALVFGGTWYGAVGLPVTSPQRSDCKTSTRPEAG